MTRMIDITGRKFGRLSVVDRAENKNGRVMWNCICSCGAKKTTSSKSLINGDAKSCGCLHKEQSIRNLPDNKKPIGYERVNIYGYVDIKTAGGFVRKHVHVMEQHTGKMLEKGLVVHHIDHDKTNNDISNLKIMENGEHTTLHHTGMKRKKETCRLISEKAKARTIKNGHRGIKLTSDKVKKIKLLVREYSFSYSVVAELFDVTKACIAAINQNRIWRTV